MRRCKSVLDRNPGGMKAAEESSFSTAQEVCFREKEFFFLTERCGNVVENKGRLRTLFSIRRRKSVLGRNPGGTKAAEEPSFSTAQEACFREKESFF